MLWSEGVEATMIDGFEAPPGAHTVGRNMTVKAIAWKNIGDRKAIAYALGAS